MDTGGERTHRLALWGELRAADGDVKPSRLRELAIYVGSQGVFFDKGRTSALHPGGITMSILHTGTAYSDEISEDCLLYSYPDTERPPARDAAEVSATKAAKQLAIPIFVISPSSTSSALRRVRLGWVEDWDDEAKLFLIRFGEGGPPITGSKDASSTTSEPVDEAQGAPFVLLVPKVGTKRLVDARPSQQKFKFEVLKRYGPRCCVCDLDVLDLLDAAHVVPKSAGGSDHPANGLVFCALHHRAFDAGMFAFEPGNLAIRYRRRGPTAGEVRLTRTDLLHLRALPHEEAASWAWTRWKDRAATAADPQADPGDD